MAPSFDTLSEQNLHEEEEEEVDFSGKCAPACDQSWDMLTRRLGRSQGAV